MAASAMFACELMDAAIFAVHNWGIMQLAALMNDSKGIGTAIPPHLEALPSSDWMGPPQNDAESKPFGDEWVAVETDIAGEKFIWRPSDSSTNISSYNGHIDIKAWDTDTHIAQGCWHGAPDKCGTMYDFHPECQLVGEYISQEDYDDMTNWAMRLLDDLPEHLPEDYGWVWGPSNWPHGYANAVSPQGEPMSNAQ
ncbi:uncharacterized protein LTR77_000929 [Saxophila tyrrhenica]|uniref:Uncharacterized protein n=1 Tax=Saxophila tyrrhenica TaxID=1690608 RepID=A0AAV9PP01_9PEZI|nr:hypothetical protein LTR77_000929 [Saxophila tyrrhenica]